jgi:hypothetical protein
MQGFGTMEWGYSGQSGDPWPLDLKDGHLNYNIFELHQTQTTDSNLGDGLIGGSKHQRGPSSARITEILQTE